MLYEVSPDSLAASGVSSFVISSPGFVFCVKRNPNIGKKHKGFPKKGARAKSKTNPRIEQGSTKRLMKTWYLICNKTTKFKHKNQYDNYMTDQ